MTIAIKKINLEHDLVQLLTKEVVKAGLESPLRESILEAVEERTNGVVEAVNEDTTAEAKAQGRLTKVIQGGTVFIVMFVVLYVTLRKLTSDEVE